MKYIIDVDSLCNCLKLLPLANNSQYRGEYGCVYLHDVISTIENFPKEENTPIFITK